MKNILIFCKSFCLQFFIIFLFLQQETAQAQKLQSWKTPDGNLIFQEYLSDIDPDYYTINLALRCRGEYNTKYRLISQKKIKSPSPQDCKILKICSDTIYIKKGEILELMTYKVRRKIEILYIRPVPEPLKQWDLKQVEFWK